MKAHLQSFARNQFARNTATLSIGTALAQAIPIALSPILTRLYTPEDFGVFGLFLALTGLLSVAATGRYELAVMLPKQSCNADLMVVLSGCFAVAFSLFLLVIVALFNVSIASSLGNLEITPWLYAIPFSVLLAGIYNALNCWLNRQERYARMSGNRVLQTGTGGLTQVAAGLALMGSGGLIVGTLGGQLVATTLLARTFIDESDNAARSDNLRNRLLSLARSYVRHPIYLLPAQMVGTAAQHLPVFITSVAFGPASTGFLTIAQRLISLPTSMIANAVGDVYRQRAAEEYRERGAFRGLFLKTLLFMSIISALPTLLLIALAPSLFAFVFGEAWREAGAYASVLAIGAYFQMIFKPVDTGPVIVGAVRYTLAWNLARFAMVAVLGLLTLAFNVSMYAFLCSLVGINIIIYLIDGAYGYFLASGGRLSNTIFENDADPAP